MSASLMILAAALFFGCNEAPTELGSSLITDTVAVYPLSSSEHKLITRSDPFFAKPQSANVGVIYQGKYKDLNTLTLITFQGSLPDTLSGLTPDEIRSVELLLYPMNYRYGDTNSPVFNYSLLEPTGNWSVETDWEEARNLINGDIYKTLDGLPELSSDTTEQIIEINTALFKQRLIRWLNDEKRYADATTEERDTITRDNNGLLLLASENTNVVQRYYSQGIGKSGRPQPTLRFIVDRGAGPDTIVTPSSIDMTLADSDTPPENSFYVQGLVRYQTRLYFDLSMIPPEAGIHQAMLQIHYDTENSFFSNQGIDSTLRAEFYADDEETTLSNYYLGGLKQGTMIYEFPSITSAAQSWIRNGGKGYLRFMYNGVIDDYEPDKLVIHGPDGEDPEKRPSLRIIYSIFEKKDQ
ncbi:MAG: hypothetical protein ACOC2K_02550 [Bacteroidota bacterium]